MKRIYNQIPYMENLGRQITTPVSDANSALSTNRPTNAPYRMSWPRCGFMSQRDLNDIRHYQDVYNSTLKRRKIAN